MLIYPRSFSGIGLLFTCAGSALPRAIVPAIIAGVWCLIIEAMMDFDFVDSGSGSANQRIFSNPFPYQVFSQMVAFALVFRTNVAYNRYWEGITNFKNLSTKWGDCASMLLSFDTHTKTEEAKATQDEFSAFVVHRMSLLHALAVAHLRREVDFRIAEDSAPATPIDPFSCFDDEAIERRSKQTIEKQCCFSVGYMLQLFCNFSNFMRACKHSTKRYEEHLRMTPLQVLGGVTKEEEAYLSRLDSEARVNALFGQVLAMCNRRRAAGGVQVDPPVLARFHHELCNGMQGFQQACKLEDTPFPFPYAQVVSFVLTIFLVSYPMIAVSLVEGMMNERAYWLPPLLSFFTTLTYFGFHEVARELEDPFLHPPNELPMIAMHETFNTRLTATWEGLDVIEYQSHSSDAAEEKHNKAGLAGFGSTNASSLLRAWKQREGGLQTDAYSSFGSMPPLQEGAEGHAIELMPTGSRSESSTGGQKSLFKSRPKGKPPKSGSHVRNAVRAQRLSFQLVSVP
mmetsp:Transcript_20456/g.52058  ORF Transcript_20456/g.52058 Transcript_20456/m.52058 type:complete len:511 (-) Transcript_20456:423-1955(-)